MGKKVIVVNESSSIDLIDCNDGELGILFMQDCVGGNVGFIGNNYFGGVSDYLNKHHVQAYIDSSIYEKHFCINTLVTDLFGKIVLVNNKDNIYQGFTLDDAEEIRKVLSSLKLKRS